MGTWGNLSPETMGQRRDKGDVNREGTVELAANCCAAFGSLSALSFLEACPHESE